VFEGAYTDALAKIIESNGEEKPLPDAPEPEQPAKKTTAKWTMKKTAPELTQRLTAHVLPGTGDASECTVHRRSA
jgi:hypothetical protein